MTRILASALVLLALASNLAAASRVRAVRSPAPACTFSLSPGFATTVAAAGLTGGIINVTASGTACSSWNAYSLTDWVVVTRNNNAVLVDVAPNPTTTARTATILVAGIRYAFSQEAETVVISPPIAGNVLSNPGFDTGLAPWGFQDRFPNGPGSAAWTSVDARGNPNSGSIRLRNVRAAGAAGHTFQQLQCVAVDASQVYEYGGTFHADSRDVSAVFAIVEYADDGCDVAAVLTENQTPRIDTPGTWQTESYTKRMGPTSRSAFVVIGSLARVAGTHDVLIDDVFLKKR